MVRRLGWRWVAAACACALVVAGCGSDDDDDDSSAATEAADEPETTAASTDAPADDVDDTAPDDTDAPAATDATAATTAAVTTEPPASVAAVDILTDFGDVCRGVALPGATAYDPSGTGVHPVITMIGEHPAYSTALGDLPDHWDPVVGEEQTVELIACLARTSATLRQSCDGYQDDAGNDTGNTVDMYDAAYDVQLVAATTGDVVAATQLEATDDVCPMFVFFDPGDSVKDWYAEPTDALVAWLSEFVET